jgi:hypothetical protein
MVLLWSDNDDGDVALLEGVLDLVCVRACRDTAAVSDSRRQSRSTTQMASHVHMLYQPFDSVRTSRAVIPRALDWRIGRNRQRKC